MSLKTDAIKKMYTDLDSTDRKIIRDFIEDFEKEPTDRRFSINENLGLSLKKAFTSGPLSSVERCPTCGK